MRGFNFQPSLVSETVLLRPLLKGDYGGLYLCASDRRLWAGHPSKERYKETEFRKWFTNAIQSKVALVIVDAKTNDIIGSSRFYIEDSSPKDICIGYTFISRQYWGGAINYDVKK